MKAVSYCRYSTDNQRENSILYQINAAQDYCERHKMELVDVYSDEAQSGMSTQRDGLQRLLSACKDGSFEAVVIYDQSRLSRNVVDWFSLRETLSANNIKLFSCTETLQDNNLDPSAFLSEGVHAIFNEMHVRETRKKTIAGVTTKAKRGEFCGGSPPLGYNVENGEYVINNQEAPAIRLLFDMYVNGHSYNQIMSELAKKGFKSKRGAKIGTNAIYYLLINERYTGTFIWNQYQYKQLRKRIPRADNPNHVRIENAIPAIIEKNTWERAMKRMSENKRGANKAKREYLLSGMITCGNCGGTFTGFASKNRRTGEETIYYTCGTKGRLKTCDAKNLRGDDIEAAVYYTVKDEMLNKKLIERTADNIINIIEATPNESVQIKKEIAKRKKSVDNLMNAIAEIDSSRPSYSLTLEKIDKLLAETKIYEARLRESTGRAPIDREQLINKLNRDTDKITGDFIQRRAVLREYVNKIIITDETVDIQLTSDYDIIGGTTQI